MFRKIAVPLDGSALAEKALPFAAALANRLKAELLLIRVAQVPGLRRDTPDYEKEVLDEAESYLHKVKEAITKPTLMGYVKEALVETLVVYGDTAPELIEITPFEKADLIVMTTHGRTGLAKMLLGSVANRVLRYSRLPVVLIKPENVKSSQLLEEGILTDDYEGGLEAKILVTLDGTPQAEAVIEPAIELAKETGATFHLLQVVMPSIPVEMGVGYYSYGTDLDAETQVCKDEAHRYLNGIAERLAAEGLSFSTAVKVGSPAEEIVEYAKTIKAEMVAMATHARNPVSRFFLGSVADEVMRRSHLPVLMVHTAKAVEEEAKISAKEVVISG